VPADQARADGSRIIHINWKAGTLIGGSDPRKDGAGIGFGDLRGDGMSGD
jgi:hypothetical protein